MYPQLCSWDNLLLAYRKAAKGKRGHPNVAAFEYRLEDNLLALQRELRDQTYQPGAYTSFYIHEPKRRLISAAPFRDRVVHHALCNLLTPIFERSFIDDSYANRVGKGTHRALNRCQEFARRYRYVLQCDVRQFFPSIDHAILRDTLARKIDDARVLWLVDQILASGVGVLSEDYAMVWFQSDDLFAADRPRGLPIGNLTSQFWANCYLNPFDHFVQRELKCPAYLRYVDDFLLFADDQRALWEFKRALIERLARFRLTIHASAQVHPADAAIPFLGFLIFPERRRLKSRKGWRFARRLRAQSRRYADGEITLAEITASVQGWVNHARYANTTGLRRAILGGRITADKCEMKRTREFCPFVFGVVRCNPSPTSNFQSPISNLKEFKCRIQVLNSPTNPSPNAR
ncbi:MAG: reverse transcriptase domain-containing protein [Chloroflexota bacterium]